MIKSIAKEDNPREKAIIHGIEALNNAELLAIILRTGNQEESVIVLAQRLLKSIGGMAQLTHVSYADLVALKGIKAAKAIAILSVVELSKRLKERCPEQPLLSPNDIYMYIKNEMMLLKQEHFVILCLNNRHGIIKQKTIFIGSLNMSVVTPREVFKEAISVSSAKLIMIHNHPSGDAHPSSEDLQLTEQFMKLGDMLMIDVLDHIIVGWKQFYSIKAGKCFYEEYE